MPGRLEMSAEKKDINLGVEVNVHADFGGDLAVDTGMDLNVDIDAPKMEKADEFGFGSIFETGGAEMEGTGAMSGLGRDTAYAGNAGENLNDAGMDAALDSFRQDNWADMTLSEQKEAITDLADFAVADTGNENPPEIVFRGDMPDGSYGGYNSDTNTIEINQNMLDDSAEAADTIAHEMWHAYQQQCLENPGDPRSAEYKEAFDNYISPEYDFEAYQNQMVEAEARDYAQEYKNKLAAIQRGY